MKDLIEQLRGEDFRVTIHDAADRERERVRLVLAVVIDEPLDVWYVSLIMRHAAPLPKLEGNILFFPELIVDAETYAFICA
jgi:hypothetical protein